MRKCDTCGKRFKLLAKDRYEVVRRPVGLNALVQETVYYNAFDCPKCGCQNIVGVVEKNKFQIKSENEFGSEYRKEVSQIIDKYRTESEAEDADND